MTDRHSSQLRDYARVSARLTPLLAALLYFTLPPAPLQAQDSCIFYSDYNSESYTRFPGTNFISGGFTVYHDAACQGEPAVGLETGPLGYVRAASQRDAAKICTDVHERTLEAYRDFTRYSSQEIWWCHDPDAPSRDKQRRPPLAPRTYRRRPQRAA